MPYYTNEQIQQTRSIDLLTYLQTYEPTELVKLKGNTYCTRDHSSLKISNGKWMWWSQGFGGVSALDYLIKVKGLSFMEAMKILTKENDYTPIIDEKVGEKGKSEGKRKLLLPEKNGTNDHVIRYLLGRGIDGDLIEACIRKSVLYESRPFHNCIFVGFDEKGIARYACYRSTNGKKMMGDAVGSDKRYSFRTNSSGRELHIFESPIDLLSYMTLKKMETGRWLPEPMLSLGGVYEPNADPEKRRLPVALRNMLENHSEVTGISLHLDNDQVGRSAAWGIDQQLNNKYNITYEPALKGKDFNDYLMYMKRL
ncbi:MAG: DUF3991 and TOPRIM domain-containing protein [Mogibacterium sp.]|nr:DUF3991 and TOPRIM domain-containing protein [Mogibacterium sp.]